MGGFSTPASLPERKPDYDIVPIPTYEMKHIALILIIIAGLCLAVIVMAQAPAPVQAGNNTPLPESGTNTTPASGGMTGSNASEEKYVQGELLVRFNNEAFPNMNALDAQSMQAHATIGDVRLDTYPDLPGLELVRLPLNMSPENGIAYYQSVPTVLYAEKNAVYSIENAPGQGNTSGPEPAGNTTASGDVFVKYNITAFASPADLQVYANATNAAINASLVTDYTLYGMPGLQLVGLDANMTNEQAIAYYSNITHVVYADPNVQYKAVETNQTANATPS
jgi:hypothetical protein